ncbi:MAG: PASTA domain-containing protein [Archangium sp.]|nr:PASTA domain-containing protein [Archangium sp.]
MRDLKQLQTEEGPSRWMRFRVVLLGFFFVCGLTGAFARAVQLQVHQREKLKGLAEDQYVREIDIPARRGDIFDRRGVALAQSVEVDSMWLDPSMLPDERAAAKQLAKALDLDVRELTERFGKTRRFVWVKRQVTPAEVAKVKALGIPGVGFTKEPRRFYPQRELGAHVIGVVGTDAQGLDGLELSFDDELSGNSAKREGFRDARGRKLLTHGLEAQTARHGATVTLTIDRQLQYVVEKALQKAVDDAKAVGGMAVMLDPRPGEVLALANAPRFNPNSPQGSVAGALRNRAVTDTFEPGSTFKSFVMAAALESGAVTPETELDCENGSFQIGRHVIHDTHRHGVLKPQKILQVSSNICTAKVAQRLGKERLVKAYQDFGFGERYGLGLPGEGRGVVPFPKAEIQLATEAFGQGLTATTLQVAAGYAALANGGVLMKPYIVSTVVDADGLVLIDNKPSVVRRVVSEKTARTVVSMLETVVEKEGTATRARMDEYRVAGKTGTAQKADPVARGYSDKRVASFAGMVPAEAPRAVIVVVIDEPKADMTGGMAAAPAFKEIATATMPYLAVPPSRVMPAPVQAVVAKATPVEKNPAIERIDAVTEVVAGDAVRVPNVTGSVGRIAVAHMLSVALEPRLNGTGRVVAQHPPAGSVVEKGSRVSLELAGHLPSSSP